MRQNIIPLAIIISLIGCSKYDYDNSELNNSEFKPYVDSFLEEARIRGKDVNVNEVNFYLADIEDENVGGLCNYRKEEIIINRDSWKTAREIDKELLVYHELGHCVLGRNHRNETSENGNCLSIMRGMENDFMCSKNIFSTLWREYYLDELFNKKTILPDWYTDNQEYVTNYINKVEIVSIENLNTNFYDTTFDFNEIEKYVIEFTFKNWATVANANNDDFVATRVDFGGFYFGSTPLSQRQHIRIDDRDSRIFHTQSNYIFDTDIKLTIKRNNDLLQYFIDEQFIHAMELQPFKNNIVEASYDGPINMGIKIFQFE